MINWLTGSIHIHITVWSCLSDTHNTGRGRGGLLKALSSISAKTLCIGITSDILFPVEEQKYVAANIPDAEYVEIDSFYGHDGFLIESELVTEAVRKFWEGKKSSGTDK